MPFFYWFELLILLRVEGLDLKLMLLNMVGSISVWDWDVGG